MPGVILKPSETLESAIRRYKRACEKAGIPAEGRRRECYEKPSEVQKREKAAAIKRQRKRLMRDNPFFMAKMKRKH
ncbi:MAG: 30S ribosomal protein S21 [Candidatus Aquirickettsiella sp.]